MTTQSVVLAAALATFVLTLGGCAVDQGSGRSSEDARGELYAVLDETQATVGGDWENQDDPTARGCVIHLWIEGEQFPGLRLGPPPSDLSGTLATVKQAWAAWGYRVEMTRVGEIIELQGRNNVRELIIFRVSSEAMTLHGESECRPARA